ncbi:SDR family NAD(P)-dependent oxidoreductase [Actinotalea sp. JY-7885]|uniref:SDR family NAD(P)-dependent oxidoreductase n=2 Tax=unclassified Actinotalea TaxID=2638618 RepID=UPI00165E8E37|nr:SDR family NAD(P)-dependent oxidoreductase [Actinotalea sp. JY-7885]
MVRGPDAPGGPRMPRAVLLATGMARTGAPPDRVRERVGGRTVVVTGASRGIGAATAERLAAVGARVVLLARGAEALDDVVGAVRSRGGTAHAIAVDLRDPQAAAAAGERILAEHGTPAVVVSNAGHSIHRFLADYADRFHDVTRTAGVNYLGPVALLLRLLPAMTAARAGHLVLVSTTSVSVPLPGWSAYGASKSALDAWVASVAPELAVDGVATTTLRLPLVHTAMSAATPAYRRVPGLLPDDVAALVTHSVVARPRVVDPWWSRAAGLAVDLAPGPVDRLATGYVRAVRAARRRRDVP